MNHLLFMATDDSVRVASRATTGSDQERGPWEIIDRSLPGHEVTCVTAQDGIVLAGTTRGIYSSEDQGRNWSLSNDRLTADHIRWLAHHPERRGEVLAGTEPAAIFLSRDAGQTWDECSEVTDLRRQHEWYLPYSDGAGCVRGFSFTPGAGRIYAAVEVGGLLCSDDCGQSWRLVAGSSGSSSERRPGYIHADVHSVAVHPQQTDLVFAATGGGLYASMDRGDNWELLYDCYCRAAWLDPEDPNHVILGPADGVDKNGRIEETNDGGVTWVPSGKGLTRPWANHMVERLYSLESELLAVLSNGALLTAHSKSLKWQQLARDAGRINAVSTSGH